MKKTITIIIVSVLLTATSCGQDKIAGVWVRETPNKMQDTIFIKKIKDNTYSVGGNAQMGGVTVKSKTVTGNYENNKLLLDNDMFLKFNKENQIVIGKTIYIKVN
tara:strand:- start:6478 stop:6792 length:315 start_codon:yes stop_codon:yes gene_type:complete